MKETAKILIREDYETVSSLVRFGDVDLVQLLLDAKYDLNRRGAWGRTLLHNAIMEDKPIIAHKLLEQDAEFDQADGNGDTPLALAPQKGQRQTADILLDMGASTKNTTAEQWRNAYRKPQCSVMHITRSGRKTSLNFLEENTQDDIGSAVPSQAINLL
jgi:ankyrin repeat protein